MTYCIGNFVVTPSPSGDIFGKDWGERCGESRNKTLTIIMRMLTPREPEVVTKLPLPSRRPNVRSLVMKRHRTEDVRLPYLL